MHGEGGAVLMAASAAHVQPTPTPKQYFTSSPVISQGVKNIVRTLS